MPAPSACLHDLDRDALAALADAVADLLAQGRPRPGGCADLAASDDGGVHLVRSLRGGVWLALTRRPAGRSRASEAADREALLRRVADTRWADSLVAGLDPQGREWVAVALDERSVPVQVDEALAQLLAAQQEQSAGVFDES